MGVEQDVLHMKRRLARKENKGQLVSLLTALNGIPVTMNILKKTRIGHVVEGLRKSSSEHRVKALAMMLVKKWAALIVPAGKSQKAKVVERREVGSDAQKSGGRKSSDKSTVRSMASGSRSGTERKEDKWFEESLDPVRVKGRELILEALKCNPFEGVGNIYLYILAAKIEHFIYKDAAEKGFKYKARIRSKVENLKNPKNSDLKLQVIKGHITAKLFAHMSIEEMACKDLQALRKQMAADGIRDHTMAVTEGSDNKFLSCPKCKQQNCSYNQLQTLSGDEPMTTFCFCIGCGWRWRFN